RDISAPKKELKITPVKIIVSTRMARSMRLANNRTIKIVINEATILKSGSVNEPITGREIPKKIVITAPTDAPEDTPNVNGSANGFRNKPWKAAPAIARDAPIIPDKITRGSRIFHTILIYIESTLFNDPKLNTFAEMIRIKSVNGTDTVPIDVPNRPATIISSPRNT